MFFFKIWGYRLLPPPDDRDPELLLLLPEDRDTDPLDREPELLLGE